MKKLKIAYFGSPDFSARLLEKLVKDKNLPIEIKLVVTQPDKPMGRKRVTTPTPVKLVAQKYSLEIVYQLEMLHVTRYKLREFDLAFVFAYAHKIPKSLLDLPRYGFVGIHPSLLPLYRGTSPTTYPLILGDKTTGVSLIQMNEKIDEGPVLAQEKLDILPDEKRPDLELRLTDLAFEMIKKSILHLPNLSSIIHHPSSIIPSYAPLLTKDDGFIELESLKKCLTNQSLTFDELPNVIKKYYVKNKLNSKKLHVTCCMLHDIFRGLYPWPGLWTYITINSATKPPRLRSGAGKPRGLNVKIQKRLKLTNFQLDNFINLKLISVQLEGKKEVDFKTFNKAYKIM